jgi:cobalt-zinc-cadmium efflux system membrane fusion protein
MNSSHESIEPAEEFHEEERAAESKTWTRWVRRSVIIVLLIVLLVPPAAAIYSFISGIPLHLLAGVDPKAKSEHRAGADVTLVPGEDYTIDVPDEVCAKLGIAKRAPDGSMREAVADAEPPSEIEPLIMPGTTMLNPNRLARVKARFAPARVVEVAKAHDFSRETQRSEFREVRQGDRVKEGELLAVLYSVEVGTKKNDLLDALVQLELDQTIMDRIEENRDSVTEVYYLTMWRNVQADRNAVNRALNNLSVWDIPQDEIDALHAEAKKISADKNAWFKTPSGRWAKGDDHPGGKISAAKEKKNLLENPWARVTLRAPFDGVIVERNLHEGEMVVDNTVNLFQIADVDRLLVIAYCPEDELPKLESLSTNERTWTVETVSAAPDSANQNASERPSKKGGLHGTIDEIGYVIDPNMHTAVIKGYVENPGQKIRGGQYVKAVVRIPPPKGVVEIPVEALIDDGIQSLVFIQPEAGKHRFTMRRVEVTHRFERTVFVRSTEIPQNERLTAKEAEEGLLPKEPLRSGELCLMAGSLELKATVMDLKREAEHQARMRQASKSEPEGNK